MTEPYCVHRDPETGECMRRLTRCTCNPPRCYVCGRFMTDWFGVCSDECEAKILADVSDDMNADTWGDQALDHVALASP